MAGQQVFILPEDELKRMMQSFCDDVVERLRPQLQVVEQSISHKEAAAFLKISPDTLTRHLKDGTYPASIIHINGRRKHYYKSELKKLLDRS